VLEIPVPVDLWKPGPCLLAKAYQLKHLLEVSVPAVTYVNGCKPLIRPGLKKILRFIEYYSIVTIAGERWFRCISPDHEKNLGIWLKLLEFDVGV
jgi:hypothetical protein